MLRGGAVAARTALLEGPSVILFDGRYPLFYSMPAAAGSRWRRARVHLFNQTCGNGEPDAICRAASRIQMLIAEVSGGGFGHDDWRLAAVDHDGALWLFDGGAANRSWPRERRGTHPNPALRRHTKPSAGGRAHSTSCSPEVGPARRYPP